MGKWNSPVLRVSDEYIILTNKKKTNDIKWCLYTVWQYNIWIICTVFTCHVLSGSLFTESMMNVASFATADDSPMKAASTAAATNKIRADIVIFCVTTITHYYILAMVLTWWQPRRRGASRRGFIVTVRILQSQLSSSSCVRRTWSVLSNSN